MSAKQAKASSNKKVGESRRKLPPEARREQILEAAHVCFGESGYHAATMDDLVRASGLSKGSLYWHFQSKEEVFLGLLDAVSENIFADWDAINSTSRNSLEILRRNFESSVESFSRERTFLRSWIEFLSHPAARKRMSNAYADSRGRLAKTIEDGRAEGSLRAGPPAEQVAASLIGVVEGLLLQGLVDPKFDLKMHVATAWEITSRGLCV